jgi:hypothetical protein
MVLSSRGKGWVGVTVGVIGGAIAGGLVALGAVHSLAQASGKPATSAVRAEPGPPRDDKPLRRPEAAESASVRHLEERLKKLEAAGKEAEGANAHEPPPEPPTRAEHQAHQAKLIDEHRQQAADRDWALMAKGALSEDFGMAKAQGLSFELAEVDCRTTSCLLTAEWNTRDEALSQYEYLMHYPTRANCARQVLVSDEANSAGKITATIVYDCTDWRAEGATLSPAVPPPPFRAAPPAPPAEPDR